MLQYCILPLTMGASGRWTIPSCLLSVSSSLLQKLLRDPTRILTHVQNTFAAVDGWAVNDTCNFCGIHYEGRGRAYRVHRTQLPRNEHEQKHSLLCSPAGRRSLGTQAVISTSPDTELDFRHPLSPNWDLHHRSRKRLCTVLLQKWLSAALGYLLLIFLCLLKNTLFISPVAKVWFCFAF